MNQSRNKLRIISINIIDNNMAYLLSRNYSMYYYPLNIQIIYNKKRFIIEYWSTDSSIRSADIIVIICSWSKHD